MAACRDGIPCLRLGSARYVACSSVIGVPGWYTKRRLRLRVHCFELIRVRYQVRYPSLSARGRVLYHRRNIQAFRAATSLSPAFLVPGVREIVSRIY
jgi:hypothetical protein